MCIYIYSVCVCVPVWGCRFRQPGNPPESSSWYHIWFHSVSYIRTSTGPPLPFQAMSCGADIAELKVEGPIQHGRGFDPRFHEDSCQMLPNLILRNGLSQQPVSFSFEIPTSLLVKLLVEGRLPKRTINWEGKRLVVWRWVCKQAQDNYKRKVSWSRPTWRHRVHKTQWIHETEPWMDDVDVALISPKLPQLSVAQGGMWKAWAGAPGPPGGNWRTCTRRMRRMRRMAAGIVGSCWLHSHRSHSHLTSGSYDGGR